MNDTRSAMKWFVLLGALLIMVLLILTAGWSTGMVFLLLHADKLRESGVLGGGGVALGISGVYIMFGWILFAFFVGEGVTKLFSPKDADRTATRDSEPYK